MFRKANVALLLAPAALALGAVAWTSTSPISTVAPRAAVVAELAPAQAAASRLVVATSGNEARYRVRERLATMELPYDAIGKTSAVTGAIVIDNAGRIVPAQSKIVVNVTGLKSDQERRDGYVQRNLLKTAEHPTVEIAPTAIRGLTGPLPTSGSRTFQMVGNLTVMGVTKPTTWDVTATFNGGQITGTAITEFTFADFGIEKPGVPIILSLADNLKLEYEFNLVRQNGAS